MLLRAFERQYSILLCCCAPKKPQENCEKRSKCPKKSEAHPKTATAAESTRACRDGRKMPHAHPELGHEGLTEPQERPNLRRKPKTSTTKPQSTLTGPQTLPKKRPKCPKSIPKQAKSTNRRTPKEHLNGTLWALLRIPSLRLRPSVECPSEPMQGAPRHARRKHTRTHTNSKTQISDG